MKGLESVLVRALTDSAFLKRLKQGDADLEGEYSLSKSEKEILSNLLKLHDGQGLDAVVGASSEAMAQLLPRRGISYSADLGYATFMLERAAIERVAPKLERVAPKLERAAPKLERAAPKLERVAPKLERAAPKLERVAPKLERAAPKLERVVPKLEQVEGKLARLEGKLARLEASTPK